MCFCSQYSQHSFKSLHMKHRAASGAARGTNRRILDFKSCVFNPNEP